MGNTFLKFSGDSQLFGVLNVLMIAAQSSEVAVIPSMRDSEERSRRSKTVSFDY
jgi:hypothetical protein